MKRISVIIDWLKRARSNLALAKLENKADIIFYEDLCFDAQQCVEKSLKAFCLYNNVTFPKTHEINYLIEILEENKIKIPIKIKKAGILADYSVETRYPGDYPEVSENEYKKVVRIAEEVYNWVCSKIKIKF
jgi:HEPN domain-containing protein